MPLTKNENMDAYHTGKYDGHTVLAKSRLYHLLFENGQKIEYKSSKAW